MIALFPSRTASSVRLRMEKKIPKPGETRHSLLATPDLQQPSQTGRFVPLIHHRSTHYCRSSQKRAQRHRRDGTIMGRTTTLEQAIASPSTGHFGLRTLTDPGCSNLIDTSAAPGRLPEIWNWKGRRRDCVSPVLGTFGLGLRIEIFWFLGAS